MKAITYGAVCALTAASALATTIEPVRNLCTLLAAIAFCGFIANVGRRPVR